VDLKSPIDVVVTCRAAAQTLARILVNTDPASIGALVGITGLGQASNMYVNSAPLGNREIVADINVPAPPDREYRFNNWRQGTAVLNAPTVLDTAANTARTTVNVTSDATYTATYNLFNRLTVNITGTGCTVTPASGFYAAGSKQTVTVTSGTATMTYSLQGGAQNVPIATGGSIPMTAPATLNVTCGAAANITYTLNSNPDGAPLSMTYLPPAGSGAPLTTGLQPTPGTKTLQIPPGAPATGAQLQLLTSTPVAIANSWHEFQDFTPGPIAASNALASFPAPAATSTFTANFRVICHLLTVNVSGTGTVALNPASGGIAGVPANCYGPGTSVTLTANPGSGASFTSWGGDATGTTSPVTVAMSAPRTVTAAFGASSNVTLTVATVPPGLPARIGTSGAFAPAPISAPVPANSNQTVTVNDLQVVSGTGYRFASWTGATPAGNVSATTAVGSANASATANFSTVCHVLTVNVTPANGGTVSLNPANGGVAGFPNNCYAPGSTVTLTAAGQNNNVLSSWGGDASGTAASVTVTMSAPRTVSAAFGPAANVSLTVNTVPQGLQARIGASGAFSAAPVTSSAVTASSSQPVAVTDNQVLAGTGYRFANWTGATPANNVAASVAVGTSNTVATANFTAACHVLTINVTPAGSGTVEATPASGNVAGFPNNCYAPNAVVSLRARPGAGRGFAGWSGGATGTAFTVQVTMDGPKTVTAAFGAQVQVTLAANPAVVHVWPGPGSTTIPGPYQTVAVEGSDTEFTAVTPQMREGTGYRFTNWTPGGATTATARFRIVANMTLTSNFAVACHVLTVNTSPQADGTVNLTPSAPALGGGYAANCFAPGTTVTLTAIPAAGRVLQSWSGATPGAGNTVTVVMTQPRSVTANFAQQQPTAPVLSARTTSRTNSGTSANTLLGVANSGGAAVNLRITAVTILSPSNVAWDQSAVCGGCTNTLPISLGTLRSNDETMRNMGFRASTGSIAVPISYRLTLQADNLPPTNITVAVP
jgi:hypothetical protein